jgi:hypothetical protein
MEAEHGQEIEAIRSEVASAVKQAERREAWQHARIKKNRDREGTGEAARAKGEAGTDKCREGQAGAAEGVHT